MGIIQINTTVTGQVDVNPRRVKIITTDSLSTVTTAGYLNPVTLEGYTIYPTDIIDMWYGATSLAVPGTYGVFLPSISNGTITLSQWSNPGDVLLPVVSGDFAVFNGTTGQIKDASYSPTNAAKTKVVMANGTVVANHIATYADTAGTVSVDAATAINGGNIQAGLSGTAGSVTSYPSTATTGSLSLTAVANSGNYANVLSNVSTGQATTWSISDPGAATGYLNASTVNASTTPVGAFISKEINCTFTALASSGHVTIQAASGSMQFKVRDIKVRYSASGLSGGGGNRLLQITDGTTVYNNAGITAALLGTPVNTVWGGTGNPLPGNVDMDTATAAGQSLYAVYAGGTTDYTAGSVNLFVLLERVA